MSLELPKDGTAVPMTYEAFHELLGASPDEDGDPCEGLYLADDVTWPSYSYENTGDPYVPGWIYDHKASEAFYGCVGDLIEQEADTDGDCCTC